MNEWRFYENVFDISKDILKYQFVPRAIRRVILEIDDALRKWKAEREVGDNQDLEDEDYMKIDSRKLSEMYEIFKDRTVQRDKYLEVFPEYKVNTLKIVQNLNKEAEDLQESIELLELPNDFANAAGALSGGLRLLSLVSSASPGLSLVTNIASVTNGAVRTVTTTAEHLVIEKHLNKAVELMDENKKKFKEMGRWFTYDDCLTKSITAAIGSETTKKLFYKFKEICEKLEKFKNDHPSTTNALKIISSLSEVLVNVDFKLTVAYFVTAGLFQIFWIHYASRWITDWSVGARPIQRLKTLCVAGMYITHTCLAWQCLQNPLNSFYSNSSVGAALGIAIDLIPPLLDAKKKKGKSATRDVVQNIKNVVEKLEKEIYLFQELYNILKVEKELSDD